MNSKLSTYTLTDLADLLKTSRRTIINYIQNGRLKAFRIGNSYRVTEESLNLFIAENSVQTPRQSNIG